MRIGVDLGGSKIEAIAFDDNDTVLYRHRVVTPARDYRGTLAAIADLISAIEQEFHETASVGIATPGSLSRQSGLVRNSNSTVLNGKPLDHDLAQTLRRPVRVANDANCFALSEATDGAAKGVESVFGLILGTGVGGGLVVRGQLVVGRNRVAGEWGHNPMPWPKPDELPGAPCYCGKRGCIETFLSGPGLARYFHAAAGRALNAKEIAGAAYAGDRDALAVIELFEDRLARGLAHIINLVDPDTIVLGGGLSNIERLYDTLPRLIPLYVFSDFIDTPVVRALHGDSSGVRGAARLWPRPSDERKSSG